MSSRPFWAAAHNLFSCPLVGLCELFTWGRWAPGFLLDCYSFTARRSGYWRADSKRKGT